MLCRGQRVAGGGILGAVLCGSGFGGGGLGLLPGLVCLGVL